MHFLLIGPLMIAAPVVLAVGKLSAEEHVFTPEPHKKSPRSHHTFGVTDENGKLEWTDPDGRPYGDPDSQDRV
jgi:hypothetical protein